MKTEKNNKFSFLVVEIIRMQSKFITTVYRKPMLVACIVALKLYSFRFCSDWAKFHTELTFLKRIFRKNV